MDIIGFLRQFRVGQFTVFDIATAYIGIFLISPLLSKLFARFNINISRTSWLWLTLPIGVMVHFILHINTPFMRMLLNLNGDYPAKIVILFMLFMGFRNIKRINKIR